MKSSAGEQVTVNLSRQKAFYIWFNAIRCQLLHSFLMKMLQAFTLLQQRLKELFSICNGFYPSTSGTVKLPVGIRITL